MEKNNASFLSNIKDEVKTCLVIGGGLGFLGSRLSNALLERDCRLHILSHAEMPNRSSKIKFFQGDIQNLDDVVKACQGVNTVFHVASMILASRLMPSKKEKLIRGINITGTGNVIKACLETGVERLVYTSSDIVVFDKDCVNGDESLPYASKFYDVYTETKAIAEQKVLNANCPNLLTCALRPGGIYGPGDKLILYRFVESLKNHQFVCTIGKNNALANSVYIDNLIDAHLLAALKLHKGSPVAGQAYFINDGEHHNYFEFLRPFMEEMGYRFPSWSIPFELAYPVAFAAELYHYVFRTSRPLLTRMEVRKVCISNCFSIEKARRDLGYTPRVSQKEGIQRSIPYCKSLLEAMKKNRKHPNDISSRLANTTKV